MIIFRRDMVEKLLRASAMYLAHDYVHPPRLVKVGRGGHALQMERHREGLMSIQSTCVD